MNTHANPAIPVPLYNRPSAATTGATNVNSTSIKRTATDEDEALLKNVRNAIIVNVIVGALGFTLSFIGSFDEAHPLFAESPDVIATTVGLVLQGGVATSCWKCYSSFENFVNNISGWCFTPKTSYKVLKWFAIGAHVVGLGLIGNFIHWAYLDAKFELCFEIRPCQDEFAWKIWIIVLLAVSQLVLRWLVHRAGNEQLLQLLEEDNTTNMQPTEAVEVQPHSPPLHTYEEDDDLDDNDNQQCAATAPPLPALYAPPAPTNGAVLGSVSAAPPKFCSQCGTSLAPLGNDHSQPPPKFCPQCGTAVPH